MTRDRVLAIAQRLETVLERNRNVPEAQFPFGLWLAAEARLTALLGTFELRALEEKTITDWIENLDAQLNRTTGRVGKQKPQSS